ncbi:MAG: histidine kinase [Arcicella sp.]|jgi:LytS/YehU family sensor histidine kinase|nr:histidine kinase [Arcicella sp.]
MKQKLLNAAIISSPIFALYAVSHPIIFGVVSLSSLMLPLIGLSFNIFIIWLINIQIVLRFRHYSAWQKAGISYGINIFFQIIFGIIGSYLQIRKQQFPNIHDFYLHPIFTSIAINIIILIICNAIEASFLKNEAEFKAKELQLENSEAQKKLLTQQLQPHFLFNALSVLKSLIRENTEDAENYTVKLSDFLRYSIEANYETLVSLEKELIFVNDYIELQKVRFEDSFVYEIDIPHEVQGMKIPVLGLQTLVENAFKHNYFTAKRPLTVRITYQNETLTVWNNKVAIKTADKTATGLYNLNKRYELIMGKKIEINETADLFSVTIYLIKE